MYNLLLDLKWGVNRRSLKLRAAERFNMSAGTMNLGAAGQNSRKFLMIANEKIKAN